MAINQVPTAMVSGPEISGTAKPKNNPISWIGVTQTTRIGLLARVTKICFYRVGKEFVLVYNWPP